MLAPPVAGVSALCVLRYVGELFQWPQPLHESGYHEDLDEPPELGEVGTTGKLLVWGNMDAACHSQDMNLGLPWSILRQGQKHGHSFLGRPG